MGTVNVVTDHLLAELDRLSRCEGDELEAEVRRAKAISDVAEQALGATGVVLEVARMQAEYGNVGKAPLELVSGGD